MVCMILCLQAVDLALPREMVEGVEQFKACPHSNLEILCLIWETMR